MVEAWCLLPDQGFDIDPDSGFLFLAALRDIACRPFDDQDQVIARNAFIGAEQNQIGSVIAAGDIDMAVRQVGNQAELNTESLLTRPNVGTRPLSTEALSTN